MGIKVIETRENWVLFPHIKVFMNEVCHKGFRSNVTICSHLTIPWRRREPFVLPYVNMLPIIYLSSTTKLQSVSSTKNASPGIGWRVTFLCIQETTLLEIYSLENFPHQSVFPFNNLQLCFPRRALMKSQFL